MGFETTFGFILMITHGLTICLKLNCSVAKLYAFLLNELFLIFALTDFFYKNESYSVLCFVVSTRHIMEDEADSSAGPSKFLKLGSVWPGLSAQEKVLSAKRD